MASIQTQPSVFQRQGFRWDAHQAYLFDIDGTLLRCRDRIHIDAFLSSARAVMGREFTLDGVVLSGNTDPGILCDAFRLSGLDANHWEPRMEEILEQMRCEVASRRADFRIDKMPGVDEALAHLHGKGATLGVATGNLESIGWLKIEFLGLREWFRFGGFSDRHPLRADMIAEAAREARALAGPDATVCVVGDTPADIAAARANGLCTIAVATGNYTFEQLMQHEPEVCATSLLALLESEPTAMICRPLTSLLVLAALAASLPCAHAKDNNADEARKLYLAGAKALEKKDYLTAEADFSKAAGLEPANPQYQAARELMVGHRATSLIEAAEKARILGRSEEARSDLLLAYHLDPKNPMIAQHMDEIVADASQPEPTLHPQDESIGPPVELVPDAGTHSFHLRTSGGELIKQVLSAYGITPTIDSSVTNGLARMDVSNVSFKDAARMVRMVTDTFFVPLDPKRVLVAKDTKENRDKYQRLGYETVYFPGLDQKEITDMGIIAHNVFGAPRATVSAANSTLSIRAPRPELAALNGTLAEMLDGHSVIQLDVRLYQIAKTKARNIGVQLPQQSTIFNIPSELRSFISQNQALVQQIISSGLARPGDLGAIALALLASGQVGGSSILSQPFAYFGGGLTLTGVTTSGITGNLAFNSSESHVIDNITMRVQDKDEATIKAGERYPIMTSSYSNFGGTSLGIPGLSSAGLSSQLAALGINPAALQSGLNQTIPQVQYQDLGLTLKVKPSIQKDRTVTLNIALKITSLAGQSLNDIPILSSQEYTAITTLDQGASAMVVSALSKQESRAVSGVPGLSELPGFQSTTNKQTQTDFSNLVIVITPHIVRMAHQQEAGRMFILPVH